MNRAPDPAAAAAAAGYRLPAEWEPHEATWLAWPHCRTDWPGKLGAVEWDFGEMARRLAAGEQVRILVRDARQERGARAALASLRVPPARVRFFRVPTDRSWTRDMGPMFVVRRGPAPRTAVVHFGFNGWALRPDWRRDADVPRRVARALGVPRYRPLRGRAPAVLEGGAIDTNGRGDLLTTEECLLDPRVQVRNPGMDRAAYEALFRRELGIRRTHWLPYGIAGADDTHGHVDDVCRFAGPRTLVVAVEGNPRDPNHRRSRANLERLDDLRLAGGARPEVVRLPFPSPLRFGRLRLPASYANFYFCNAALLVPTFNDPADRRALGVLAEVVRDRPVVGIHAANLVLGRGAIHCLTREQPQPR